MIEVSNNNKFSCYKIANCGKFPDYFLNNVSFCNGNIIYLVSVGKERFEDKWVERFVNFVKKVKPKKTIVVVADTLQRFNIEVDENIEPKRAFNKSIFKGRVWAETYKKKFSSLENLNIKYEFVHWETLKKDADFKRYHDEIQKLNQENDEFKKDLTISSREYTNRPSRVNSGIAGQSAQENSRQFLIEECAVFQVLAKDKESLAIVYPGAVTDILAYSIRHINKKYREKDNAFHWLELKRSKINNKEESLNKPLFSRSISLNETKLPFYQIPQDLDKKTASLRRSSLDSYFSEERPSKFLRV